MKNGRIFFSESENNIHEGKKELHSRFQRTHSLTYSKNMYGSPSKDQVLEIGTGDEDQVEVIANKTGVKLCIVQLQKVREFMIKPTMSEEMSEKGENQCIQQKKKERME